MRTLLLAFLATWAEAAAAQPRLFNVRLSFLAYPFTPLLSVELRCLPQMSLQAETNFSNIHGINIKAYASPAAEGGYLFLGAAFVSDKRLREDGGWTYLPYAGVGYSLPLGGSWIGDTRLGFGPTLGANKVYWVPVLKAGVGRWF